MSYNDELTSNNTDLQGILTTINALPEAGGGVETCTLQVIDDDMVMTSIYYTGLQNGSTHLFKVIGYPSTSSYDVVCGSILYIELGASAIKIQTNGLNTLSEYGKKIIYEITASAGDTVTISIHDNSDD